jgi:hypothetical protein
MNNKKKIYDNYTELLTTHLISIGFSEEQVIEQIDILQDFDPSMSWLLEKTKELRKSLVD